ncbi:pyocin knob domain-containing protein [Haemophilus influenzae]|uniref:pyocin knob domain-containing protein n=2 Tax=Haemophilus influenzae TaxID=727 RepID=UPI000D4888D6|nr:pyocin knob domain-containing protein [Haemophilus influenzae]MCK8789961.1 pyocin knob domain-containing protein [Haemophilus influenzae]MCK8863140.1 pyocin knob domain-containing protein [Haemophilus influenzae]MCK9057004.1 pyocin knob domain-containing protein [Haemophilus influenzae]PRJ30756.1 Phage Tail Collar Domain protein [Haemophilus influenzae]PRL84848.1 Phage Tail Collar Domain protein [Haemophilus influenzae]
MADFNKPTVDSEYTQFPTEIRAAISAILSFLDGEHTNVPLKAKRWNPSTKIFEEYNGAQWVPMATEYKLPVDYNSLKNKPLPNSAVNDESDTKFASSAAVKTAYDKAAEAKEAASAKQSPATTLAGYGIGNFKVEQGQGDANGYKTDGNYYLASGQNLPENGEWHIEVVSGGATNAVRQIARKANDNKIKTRFFNGSNWSEWKDAGGDGVPIGAVVSFPRAVTNPVGFLRADGSTFSQQTFPDLYRTLGNSNQLPDLTRSDVGMTAYFAVDNIPSGWIAFDSIRSTVTQQNYPELYQYLVDKYSSISNVPLAEDRFIRNTGNGLNIGQTQSDEIKKHVHKVRTHWADSSDSSIFYDKTKTVIDSRLRTATTTDDNLSDNGFMHPLLDSPMATGGAETRPRAIALKLCIKAKNTFDDVQFWVKAFGVVENAGALDAGTLAQNMQALSESVEQKIEENKQSTLREITNAKADIKQQFLQAQENLSQIGTLKTVWQGNVGSGRIDISEKCFGKTLILYLQSSSGHRLDDNNNIEIVSFEVGAEIEGKTGGGVHWLDVRQVRGFPRNGSFLNYVEVKTFAVTVDRNGTAIQIQDLAGRFVKRIDIR